MQKTFLPPLSSVRKSSCPGRFHDLVTKGVHRRRWALRVQADGQSTWVLRFSGEDPQIVKSSDRYMILPILSLYRVTLY